MDLGLAGRSAIVGGASRGLGYAIASALASEGASVTIFARTEESLATAAQSIAAASEAEVNAVVADASKPDDLARVVDGAVQKFGRVDVVVANAGGPPLGTLETLDDAAWLQAFELTFMSAVRLARLAAPHMQRNQWGRVINLLSFTVRQPLPGLMLSNALRMGVVGMAKTLSRELAPDILVNNLAPGWFATERTQYLNETRAREAGLALEDIEKGVTSQIPLGRYGRPEELAALAAFLASDQASYITGQTFLCDGGLVAAS